MKYLFVLILFVGALSMTEAQDEWPSLDGSSFDMVYYPENVAWRNYLGEDERNISPKIKLTYSRPMKKDRIIFGGLLKYGEEWRMGANEATTISFYQPVGIGGKTIEAGSYTMSAHLQKEAWTINFSSESGIWGSANRNKDLTVTSIKVPVMMVGEKREDLGMTFQEVDEQNVNLAIEWDGHRAIVPIALNPVVFSTTDKSPMDMAHYPRSSAFTNYADEGTEKVEPKVQVTYSRPQKNGRNIFGELLKSGDIWRIGANEATEIVFFQNVTINGTEISRGRYAMFARLGDTSWDIIFSKDYPIWGAYGRDESKDVATVSVPVSSDTEVLEALSIRFAEQNEKLVHLEIGWDTTRVAIPIAFE